MLSKEKEKNISSTSSLSIYNQNFLFIISCLIVGLGQPAVSYWLSILSASCGYALALRVIVEYERPLDRFLLGSFWFFIVQIIQLSWVISHPYLYIWFVYISFSALLGTQFGVFCLFITKKNTSKLTYLLGLASIWTIFEWSRLFFMSGYTWNPSGLALTASLYSLQLASVWGIFGQTFWIMFVNMLFLSLLMSTPKQLHLGQWAAAASLPYIFGMLHITYHEEHWKQLSSNDKQPLTALLVQTAFPVEEAMGFKDTKLLLNYVLGEWRQILSITSKHDNEKIDLTVFPEFTVPFGTYTYIYPHEVVKNAFKDIWGDSSINKLPALDYPLARLIQTPKGPVWFVNNAYWLQSLANLLNSSVVMGLEDADDDDAGKRHYYSSALHLRPLIRQPEELAINENSSASKRTAPTFKAERYEKRVLVPMGEYIPFAFLQELAEEYGIYSSFTAGKEAKIFNCHDSNVPFGMSICYEETFGNLMRQARQNGAEMLINLTSDVWYPNSRLPQQHFDHARLRTVENGIPLLRACNTGITGATDSLGRIIAELGEDPYEKEWLSDALKVDVPMYTYNTLYTKTGDSLILTIAFIFMSLFSFQTRLVGHLAHVFKVFIRARA